MAVLVCRGCGCIAGIPGCVYEADGMSGVAVVSMWLEIAETEVQFKPPDNFHCISSRRSTCSVRSCICKRRNTAFTPAVLCQLLNWSQGLISSCCGDCSRTQPCLSTGKQWCRLPASTSKLTMCLRSGAVGSTPHASSIARVYSGNARLSAWA